MERALASKGPLVVCFALAMGSVCASLALGRSLLTTEPWISWRGSGQGEGGGTLGHLTSVAGGLGLAAATIGASRFFVRKWEWARALHTDLRPAVRHSKMAHIVLFGAASAASEELFFRGLLATTVGVVASSIAFGLVHQMRGRARWVWAGWAAAMGLLFGGLFLATGSLAGPLLAHTAINIANLRFLRDTDVGTPRVIRRLGGLLQSSNGSESPQEPRTREGARRRGPIIEGSWGRQARRARS